MNLEPGADSDLSWLVSIGWESLTNLLRLRFGILAECGPYSCAASRGRSLFEEIRHLWAAKILLEFCAHIGLGVSGLAFQTSTSSYEQNRTLQKFQANLGHNVSYIGVWVRGFSLILSARVVMICDVVAPASAVVGKTRGQSCFRFDAFELAFLWGFVFVCFLDLLWTGVSKGVEGFYMGKGSAKFRAKEFVCFNGQPCLMLSARWFIIEGLAIYRLVSVRFRLRCRCLLRT